MKCINCGAEIEENSSKCSYCGAKVDINMTPKQPKNNKNEKTSRYYANLSFVFGVVSFIVCCLSLFTGSASIYFAVKAFKMMKEEIIEDKTSKRRAVMGIVISILSILFLIYLYVSGAKIQKTIDQAEELMKNGQYQEAVDLLEREDISGHPELYFDAYVGNEDYDKAALTYIDSYNSLSNKAILSAKDEVLTRLDLIYDKCSDSSKIQIDVFKEKINNLLQEQLEKEQEKERKKQEKAEAKAKKQQEKAEAKENKQQETQQPVKEEQVVTAEKESTTPEKAEPAQKEKIDNTNTATNKPQTSTSAKTDNTANSGSKENTNTSKMEFDNKTLNDNFVSACKQCGVNTELITKIEQADDWSNGPRYRVYYGSHILYLYAYDNGEISSINFDSPTGVKMYKEGYEAINVSNLIPDVMVYSQLQVDAEEKTKAYMNNPSTANFDWFTSGIYTRYYNYYVLNVSFSCKNDFGVKGDHSLEVTYDVKDSIKLVSLVIDGELKSGNAVKFDTDRNEIVIDKNTSSNTSTITLTEGVLGEYGKEDNFDGTKIVRYYVPQGKYKVTASSKGSGLFVESIATFKENGYSTTETYDMVSFSNTSESYEIEIKDGMCILLIINSKITLEKIN